MQTALFDLGQVVATPGALDALTQSGEHYLRYLAKHAQGDWGTLDAEDKATNNAALKNGSRIFSAYLLSDQTKIWVITEADRASTCILLPSEY